MEGYKFRVILEKKALDIKITGLTNFLSSDEPVDAKELARLRGQLVAMKKYSSILSSRIEAFAQ